MAIAFPPYYKIKQIDLSDDTNVIATGTNTQTLQPAEGRVYQIIGIGYLAPDPAGSAAGTHELVIQQQNNTSWYATVKGTTGTTVTINQNHFTGDSLERPSNDREQFLLMCGGILYASYSQPLDFIYNNDTDVAQAGTRELKIFVKEYPECD